MTLPSADLRSRSPNPLSPAPSTPDDTAPLPRMVAILPRQLVPAQPDDLDGTICIYNRRTKAYDFYRMMRQPETDPLVDASFTPTGSPTPLHGRQVRRREPAMTDGKAEITDLPQAKRRRVESLIATATPSLAADHSSDAETTDQPVLAPCAFLIQPPVPVFDPPGPVDQGVRERVDDDKGTPPDPADDAGLGAAESHLSTWNAGTGAPRSAPDRQPGKTPALAGPTPGKVVSTPITIGIHPITCKPIVIRPAKQNDDPAFGIPSCMMAFKPEDPDSQAKLIALITPANRRGAARLLLPMPRRLEVLLRHSLCLKSIDRYARLINIWRCVVQTFGVHVSLAGLIRAAACFQLRQNKSSRAAPTAEELYRCRQAIVAGMLCGGRFKPNRDAREHDLQVFLTAVVSVNRTDAAPDEIVRAFFDPLRADLTRLDPDVILALCTTPNYLDDALRVGWRTVLRNEGDGPWRVVLRAIERQQSIERQQPIEAAPTASSKDPKRDAI